MTNLLLICKHNRAPVNFSFHAVTECSAEEIVNFQGEVPFTRECVGKANGPSAKMGVPQQYEDDFDGSGKM